VNKLTPSRLFVHFYRTIEASAKGAEQIGLNLRGDFPYTANIQEEFP